METKKRLEARLKDWVSWSLYPFTKVKEMAVLKFRLSIKILITKYIYIYILVSSLINNWE